MDSAAIQGDRTVAERARANVHEAMKYCQIALPGFDDAIVLSKLEESEASVDFYHEPGAETVVLKLDSRGVMVSTQDERHLIPGIQVNSIDATGAGDTFSGAFLTEVSREQKPF